VPSGADQCNSCLSFLSLYFEYDFHINNSQENILPSKCQVPNLLHYLKASETVETVHYYGAQRYCEQMVNISHYYDPLGNRRRLSTCGFRAQAAARTALPPNANFGLSDWN